ncbi:MAG: hypothetical protein NC212_08205 [Staphylococcus sp.]|nr:hypothetical protein [Staphylococcus sp.]
MKIKKSRSTRKSQRRPVSDRFYKSLTERVGNAAAVMSSHNLAEEVMKVVDAYLESGCISDAERRAMSAECTLVFTILQPEIDKALARSAAARARHRAKAASGCGVEDSKTKDVGVPVVPVQEIDPYVSQNSYPTVNPYERQLSEEERWRRARLLINPLMDKCR